MWTDKSCIFGQPIGFNTYTLDRDTLFVKKGILSSNTINVYVRDMIDVRMTQDLVGKVFDVGNVIITTREKDNSRVVLNNVRQPDKVMRLISNRISRIRKELQARTRTVNVSNYNPEVDNYGLSYADKLDTMYGMDSDRESDI